MKIPKLNTINRKFIDSHDGLNVHVCILIRIYLLQNPNNKKTMFSTKAMNGIKKVHINHLIVGQTLSDDIHTIGNIQYDRTPT